MVQPIAGKKPVYSAEINAFLKNGDTRYEELSIMNADSVQTRANVAFVDRADRYLRSYMNECDYSMEILLVELEGIFIYHPPMAELLVSFALRKLEEDILRLEFYELMHDGMYGFPESREIIEQQFRHWSQTTPERLQNHS